METTYPTINVSTHGNIMFLMIPCGLESKLSSSPTAFVEPSMSRGTPFVLICSTYTRFG